MNKKLVGTLILRDNMCELDDFVCTMLANNYSVEISRDKASNNFIVKILAEVE